MKVLSVFFHGLTDGPVKIGRLSQLDNKTYFQYEPDFLRLNINLSKYSLSNTPELQEGRPEPFNGLHGLFADSLPDGWGLLIMDRIFAENDIDVSGITNIDRLAFIGDRAIGALSYKPDEGDQYLNAGNAQIDIDQIAEESVKIFEGEVDDVLEAIKENGLSPQGARPKSLIGICGDKSISGSRDLPDDYEYWMAKFPPGRSANAKAEGSIEFIFSNIARNSGIDFPKTQLIQGNENNLYFMTKRFDRLAGGQRVHSHTLAGLVHANFRIPDFSYIDLMKVCRELTGSHAEVSQLFQRMIFNIISGNRDDHTKNFSFLMNSVGTWHNSPAYDMTYSTGMNGQHSLDISGHGRNITIDHIAGVAEIASIGPKEVTAKIEEVSDSFSDWFSECKNYNIPNFLITEISKHINKQRKLLLPPSSSPIDGLNGPK